ncbi:MAG: hypothetical protein DWH81_12810 [Planctomycetota bacterium]|nr:MAG: hypothetical protein DWH81_12810 [Planctomycetota bacterium]
MPIRNTLQSIWTLWNTCTSASHRRTTRRSHISSDLEQRQLLAAVINNAPAIPSYNGSGNNVANPNWGSAGSDLLRQAPAAYANGTSNPAGANRPSARVISNALADQNAPTESEFGLSNFVYAWGQFIDHDLDLTSSATPSQSFNIAVPKGDPLFDPTGTGTKTIPLTRSKSDPATGTSSSNPRQQINDISAFLDGSMVYGSDKARADALRTFQGGHLKMDAGGMLPSNTAGLPNANDTHQTPDKQLFLAGDVRANENIELTSIQTIFVREHNRIADEIAKSNPNLTDEQIYQAARMKVIGEIQAITYNEFLPALLGPNAIQPYSGYKANVNPGITNEFSTAAFRVGHTMVGDDIDFLDDQGNPVRDPVALSQAFFNPNLLRSTGVDPVLKYLASDRAEEIDTQVVDSLRNFLFGAPGQGGLDLAALNIQRGRDHGLADYNTTRAAYGLSKVTSFEQITPDLALQQQLKQLYGNVNNIDLWVGGLAEKHVPGGNVGETFARIIADQFTRLRDGDRFWYQNVFQGKDLAEISNTKLADVLKRNTGLKNLQDNVFIFRTAIEGRVFADANKDGQINRQEQGLGQRSVELLDKNNVVVARTQTRPDGGFVFEELPLGTYKVREVLPAGTTSTTPPKPIVINKGMKVTGILVGEATTSTTPVVQTSISGRVFTDANRDGLINGPEQGIGGRGIQLVDANNKVVATVQSQPDGSFRFENMPVGNYQVREILPPGMVSTTPPKPITIKDGSKITGILVGEAPGSTTPAARTSIEGRVFTDTNRDGLLNGPEKGLGGRGIQLVDSNNKVVVTVQSQPDGSFRFENMPLGNYQVREILPPGMVSTTPPKPIVIKDGSKITGILVGEAPSTPPQPQPTSTSNSLTLQGSLLDSLLS